jgi:hypothetical protein
MATGTVIVDFGAFPGSNEAQVVVTGQGAIGAASLVEAWMMAAPTADHTANDHAYAAALVAITCGAIVNGTGFTIYARCLDEMQGTFNLAWAWL